MSNKAGYEWDALKRRWKPVDYIGMTDEAMKARREVADDKAAELKAQVEALIPAVAAQALLNKGADELIDLMVKLAKKAPEALLGVL